MNDENSATCRDQIHPYPASMPDGDDAILILAAKAGDTNVFARLVERHTERIYGLALRLLIWQGFATPQFLLPGSTVLPSISVVTSCVADRHESSIQRFGVSIISGPMSIIALTLNG